MPTLHTIQLLTAAADSIKATADDLKQSHTVNGVWTPGDPVDADAMISYLNDLRLAKRLYAESKRLQEKYHVA